MSIYIIRAEGTPWYKIGYTAKDVPWGRILNMQVGCPYQLEIQMSFGGAAQDEHRLHSRFRDVRGLGEWFELSELDIRWLVGEARSNPPYRIYRPEHRDSGRDDIPVEEVIALMRARVWDTAKVVELEQELSK